MHEQARTKHITQGCVISPFADLQRSDNLGYRYLGDWSKREDLEKHD